MSERKNPKGCVQIYYGISKGKTTTSIGLATRALSYGWKILALSFLKTNCNGFNYLASISENLEAKQFGRNKITLASNVEEEDTKVVEEAWSYLFHKCRLAKYDMIILDEILPTYNLDLLDFEDIKRITKYAKANNIELVLTGRCDSLTKLNKLLSIADMVTNVESIKHYFNKHCKSCNREFKDFSYIHCPYCRNVLEAIDVRFGIEL